MNRNHATFFDRPEAWELKEVLTRPAIVPQYELMSRLDMPAVQAAVWDIEPLIEKLDPALRNHAIQSSGALIADILTSRGYRVARGARGEKRRGRVRKSRFVQSGTIFEEPTRALDHHDKVMAIVDDIMVRYRHTLEELAK